MIFIPMDAGDLELCFMIADKRQASNVGRGQGARLDGVSDGLREHRIGVRGEWAVVRHYGAHRIWNHYTDEEKKRHTGDVGKYEVRSTDHPKGGLLLRMKDQKHKPPETIFIGVRLETEGAWLLGWIVARDGMVPKWWRENVRSPCWIIPPHALHPMSELPEPS
jgi:hypothetical protein